VQVLGSKSGRRTSTEGACRKSPVSRQPRARRAGRKRSGRGRSRFRSTRLCYKNARFVSSGQPASVKLRNPVAASTQTLSRQLNPTVATFQVNFSTFSSRTDILSAGGTFEVIAFTGLGFSTERDRAFSPPSWRPGEMLSRVLPHSLGPTEIGCLTNVWPQARTGEQADSTRGHPLPPTEKPGLGWTLVQPAHHKGKK
jgi:hypothetical protein